MSSTDSRKIKEIISPYNRENEFKIVSDNKEILEMTIAEFRNSKYYGKMNFTLELAGNKTSSIIIIVNIPDIYISIDKYEVTGKIGKTVSYRSIYPYVEDEQKTTN